MNWLIPAFKYEIWTEFQLEITSDIEFETGSCYHLKGQNGSGKTSFVRKVLIPHLVKNPSQQYILYLEQQVQSQLDAIKAYAAIQKPAVHLKNVEEMFEYQLNLLSAAFEQEPRPIIIILDETVYPLVINQWLQQTNIEHICLVYISHLESNFAGFKTIKQINFYPASANLTRIKA